MNIIFRKVSSQESFKKLVAFLTADVLKHGGSAGEILDMHGTLVHLTVCKAPWGVIVIHQEVSQLEALAWFVQDVD